MKQKVNVIYTQNETNVLVLLMKTTPTKQDILLICRIANVTKSHTIITQNILKIKIKKYTSSKLEMTLEYHNLNIHFSEIISKNGHQNILKLTNVT